MLEDILGSRAKVRIIRELSAHPDRDYPMEDIAKAVGMSYGTVHPAVAGLVSTRAVTSRKAGRSKLYKMNRKHPLYREVSRLMEKEGSVFLAIARSFTKTLDKKDIDSVILFGSTARNEPHPGDLDILIVTRNGREPVDLPEAVDRVLEVSDTVISPICLSRKDVAGKVKDNDRFIIGIMNEGKLLWGKAEWLGT